jgi:DNA-binding HxlR family transcriptional regulator
MDTMKKQWHLENSINCPLVAAISIVGGKWKPNILHMLGEGPMRFGELMRNIPPVSQKMLTQQLRELEFDGIVHRELYPEVPPRTEYSLTQRGESLMPILQNLYAWGAAHGAPATASASA